MDDKTSKPDAEDAGRPDPDDRATVATDEQAAPDGTDAGPQSAAPAARPADPEGTVEVVEDEQTVVDVPTAPADAPTAQMRVPDGAAGASPQGGGSENGHGPGNGQANGSVPAMTPVSADAPTQQHVPVPQARASEGPAPAPGPVPGPGPDAATPPPWRRIPGRGGAEQQEHRPEPAAAAGGGLLDEGPTAFLRAPEPEPVRQEDGVRSPVRAARTRAPRQAALQLRRLDPWSVLKLALVLAVVLFFVWLVAVGVLYGVLDGIGVWDRLNGTYADLVSGQAQTGAPLISAGRVFGFAAVVGAINSLLFAVAVTIAAFVYNVSADLVGGVEVTLSERD